MLLSELRIVYGNIRLTDGNNKRLLYMTEQLNWKIQSQYVTSEKISLLKTSLAVTLNYECEKETKNFKVTS